MPEMTSLSVGDRLVYPNQGLCTVTEIKAEEIAGQRLTFVSLVIIETGARVKVPREKLEKNGVRRMSSAADVKKVVDFLKSDSEKASLDWKKRARDNTARLSEGGLIGLAEVVKGLQVLSELRPLPPKEREQYNDARHLLVEELAASLNTSAADAEDTFDILLFVPGKDRPKRSVEEFQALAGEDDELGLDGDLIGLDGAGESEAETPETELEKAEGEGEGNDEEEPPAKPAKAAAPARKGKGKGKDADKGQGQGQGKGKDKGKGKKAPPAEAPAPKKPGRPPKPKPVQPAPPKKRGRPTKAQ